MGWGSKEFMKPVIKAWNLDRATTVLIMEGKDASSRKGYFSAKILDFSQGFELLKKYQFRLSNEYFVRNKGYYGSSEYVKANGVDGAVLGSVRDVAACFYK